MALLFALMLLGAGTATAEESSLATIRLHNPTAWDNWGAIGAIGDTH